MALQRVRGLGVREAGKRVGVSHGLIGSWRKALEDSEGSGEVDDFAEKTRRAVVDFLGGAPVEDAEGYADGLRLAVAQMEATLEDLRRLLPDEATPTPAAIEAHEKKVMEAKNGKGGGQEGRRKA